MQQFMSHCATLIQKVWRGGMTRKHVIPRLMHKARLTRGLTALIKGWRVRRIMTRGREVLRVRKELL